MLCVETRRIPAILAWPTWSYVRAKMRITDRPSADRGIGHQQVACCSPIALPALRRRPCHLRDTRFPQPLTGSKPASHGLSSRGKGVSDSNSRNKSVLSETVASGSLLGQICRLVPSGWGRAGLSRKADPVWLVSAPPSQPSPAGRENPPPSGVGSVKRVAIVIRQDPPDSSRLDVCRYGYI
jgi:hypothetical protein